MAFPTINFGSLTYDSVNLYSNESNINSIRISGDFVSGTNTITNCTITQGPLALSDLQPGMLIVSSGEITGESAIVSIVGTTITIEDNAIATATSQTARIKNPKGRYLFVDASFTKVGSGKPTDLRSVTGSEDAEYDGSSPIWGIAAPLAYTGSAGTTVAGLYGQYTITKIQSRASSTEFNFFATASNNIPIFIEDTGSQISTGGGNLLISEIQNNLLTVAGANDLAGGGQGLGLSSYQTAVGSTFAELIDSTGFPFTGSALVTGSLGVTGSFTVQKGVAESDFFIIKGADGNSKFKFNSNGVGIFGEFNTLPTAVEGGFVYSGSNFYAGIE